MVLTREELTPEQLERLDRATKDKEWWDDWWAEDYSWEGLAQKPWQGWMVLADGTVAENPSSRPEGDARYAQRPDGAKPATQQDYWRYYGFDGAGLNTEPELFTCPVTQKRFTRLHLPLKWKDGSLTPKATWPNDALDQLLQAMVAQVSVTEVWPHDVFGEIHKLQIDPDRRMMVDGGCAFGFKPTALRGAAHFQIQDKRSPFGLSAVRATFSGDADFRSATFSGNADFQGASFSGKADFTGTTFSNITYFTSVIFSEYADFKSAVFSGHAYFNDAAFAGDVVIADAVFFGPAVFSGEGAMLRLSEVTQTVGLKEHPTTETTPRELKGFMTTDGSLLPTAKRSFKKITATNAIFLDRAMFDNRDILEPSSFQNCLFLRQAVFHRSHLIQGVSFHNAHFDLALRPDIACNGTNDRPNLKDRVTRALASVDPARLTRPDGNDTDGKPLKYPSIFSRAVPEDHSGSGSKTRGRSRSKNCKPPSTPS